MTAFLESGPSQGYFQRNLEVLLHLKAVVQISSILPSQGSALCQRDTVIHHHFYMGLLAWVGELPAQCIFSFFVDGLNYIVDVQSSGFDLR